MISTDMVKRRLLFDSMADPVKASLIAGLIGVSEEGAEIEFEDSQKRLAGIVHVLPILDDMSDWLADVATGIQASHLDEIMVPEGFLEEMNAMYRSILMGSLMGVLSVLNDLGLITVNQPEGCTCGG